MALFDGSPRAMLRTVVVALLWVVGCAGGDDTPETQRRAGDAGFAERCSQSEDCQSLLCVRVDDSGGICTTTCRSDMQCPKADNWACLAAAGVGSDVCACRKLNEVERCGDGQDNDCDGQVDDCRICDGVGVPNDDPAHCGACNNACRSDQRCKNESCGCPEELPIDCGTCVATSNDASHCGACGNACGAGLSCVEGECVCPDEARPSFCGDAGCLDLMTDFLNCGECGNACPTAQGCVDGECVCPDDTFDTLCDGAGCVDVETSSNHCGECGNACALGTACDGGECTCPDEAAPDFCDAIGCVDLENDERHCGGCGEACRSDELCADGECGCPDGAVDCDGLCVDVATSIDHCGACDEACGTAQACSGGECGCTEFGHTVCEDACADLQTNPGHCGGCGQACGEGEVCRQGECRCDSGVVCDDVCVSATDPENCGACGQTCPTGQSCSESACTCDGFGLSACDAACVNLSNDPQHCGSCETACRTGESCSGGTCRCPTGQAYCEAAGACVDFTNDASHCGACGGACDPTEICQSSTCRCPASGQVHCASTGVCTDTLTNAAHCGACDDPCNPTEVCRNGSCGCSVSTQRFCESANACVDLVNNSAHCGACGVACPAGTHCTNRTCVCDQAGSTLCSGACYDLQSDRDHCGSCATACTGGFACLSGLCRCPNPTMGTAVRATNNALSDGSPSLAWDGTHVGVAYRRQGSTFNDNKTRFLLLNPDGTVVSDAEIPGSNNALSPDLIWSGSEYALVWRDSGGTRFTRLDAAGVPRQPLVLNLAGGEPGNSRGKITVTWSSTYGGYAIGGHGSSDSFLQLLGADASMPQAPNTFTHPSIASGSAQLVAAPAGGWGLAFGTILGPVGLASFNADGSRTLPIQSIGSGIPTHGVGLVHDGTSWLITWVNSARTGIVVNRGTQANTPATVLTTASSLGSPAVRVSNGTVAMAWAQLATTSPATYTVRMQRFAIPSTSSSALAPIQNPIDVLATANGQTEEVGIVYTSPTTMLAVWVDNRWGTSEIYAAPINLGACP